MERKESKQTNKTKTNLICQKTWLPLGGGVGVWIKRHKWLLDDPKPRFLKLIWSFEKHGPLLGSYLVSHWSEFIHSKGWNDNFRLVPTSF